MENRYSLNEPSVVSELIEEESVIVNLLTGSYYSTGGSGSLLWSWLCQGASPAEAARALANRFEVEEDVAGQAVRRFLDALLEQDLLRVSPDRPVPELTVSGEHGSRAAWVPPALNAYEDMKDLLLLDPVHDVDEVGWPTPRLPDPTAG